MSIGVMSVVGAMNVGAMKKESRWVSDEVFDESFCEFFIPTEDCSTAANLTGLGNTRKLFKMESFRGPQQA